MSNLVPIPNTPEKRADPNYRYKREKIVFTVVGNDEKKSYSKLPYQWSNFSRVMKQLHIDPVTFAKKFKKLIKQRIKMTPKALHFAVKEYDDDYYEAFLDAYITKYVLCKKCGLPELAEDVCKSCGSSC